MKKRKYDLHKLFKTQFEENEPMLLEEICELPQDENYFNGDPILEGDIVLVALLVKITKPTVKGERIQVKAMPINLNERHFDMVQSYDGESTMVEEMGVLPWLTLTNGLDWEVEKK